MRNYRIIAGLAAQALFVTSWLALPATTSAAETEDSAQINTLLAEAKTKALDLKRDSADMESFTRSNRGWEGYASKILTIKEHINDSGKLLTKLKNTEPTGAPWQQTAIDRIEPLLRELAANTEATIDHLNNNRAAVHFPEFKNFVKANYELASDLEELIRDFVTYGESKGKFQRLQDKLEVAK